LVWSVPKRLFPGLPSVRTVSMRGSTKRADR